MSKPSSEKCEPLTVKHLLEGRIERLAKRFKAAQETRDNLENDAFELVDGEPDENELSQEISSYLSSLSEEYLVKFLGKAICDESDICVDYKDYCTMTDGTISDFTRVYEFTFGDASIGDVEIVMDSARRILECVMFVVPANTNGVPYELEEFNMVFESRGEFDTAISKLDTDNMVYSSCHTLFAVCDLKLKLDLA